MTGRAIAAIILGISLEILGLFGNRGPLPFVRDLLAPEYTTARQGYEKLATEGFLIEGDPGFSELRRSYMTFSLMATEPPFPMDEIDGMTVTRFETGLSTDPSALKEKTPVYGYYSNGEIFMLDFNYVMAMANDRSNRAIVLFNLAFLVLGVALVFYGLQILHSERIAGHSSNTVEISLG